MSDNSTARANVKKSKRGLILLQALSPALACSLIIATTLLITPYTWTYDQILLIIPILVTMLEMMGRQYPFLLSASLFLLFDVLTIFLLVISARIEMEVLNSLIPPHHVLHTVSAHSKYEIF